MDASQIDPMQVPMVVIVGALVGAIMIVFLIGIILDLKNEITTLKNRKP